MRHVGAFLLCLFLTLAAHLPVRAAVKQPLSEQYIASYFTTVAAASCLGVYLPDTSSEFSFLRSYGWDVEAKEETEGEVETHFAIAHRYFPEFKRELYLVTFRGSASKKDWKLNLKTKHVNYGGATLEEMAQLAAEPYKKNAPAVHAGFNSYVDTVLRAAVVDENSRFKGVFASVAAKPEAYLILTGHSLGGAVATLLGERLASLGLDKDKFTVVTFGAPAIGNAEFAEQYADKINLYRITNTKDPVPGSLQTFFRGYKQFGQQQKYDMNVKRSGMQHDIAMYFDYTVGEYFRVFDREVELDRLSPIPVRKTAPGTPLVALWVQKSAKLESLTYAADLERFAVEEYERMLPAYVVMAKQLEADAYRVTDIISESKKAGADYVLVLGIEGSRPRNEKFWYLTLHQSLFAADGRMLLMNSIGNKTAAAVGNIQALGQNLLDARRQLAEHLEFLEKDVDMLAGGEA